MKFGSAFTIIFLGIVLPYVSCSNSTLPDNCKWTDCVEHVISCQNLCSKNMLGWYTGSSIALTCGEGSLRCECCRSTENGDRKWTKKCHGRRFGMVSVCMEEFGYGYVPTGNKRVCSEAGTLQYECSN